ncbi:Outer membrane protein (porin) [Polynucleobacter duraquae]|uniref:Outer membrane protein (Porin) n=1 Tax=Polynucleobacter duraquae TaxID=1835254 RepID=A0A0E3ZIH2_9BURK|nr:porin [Polynucleobacter duraquae]AKD24451.1 Outer membrane protein (porin) [Polynucleobacter duraquae]
MKKSLFAVAAVTAFAGAAQAQSSVTVYGILDMGYIGTNTRNVSGANIKTNTNQIGNSAEQSSRLGFRGTEDLGGGTSAFFTAEFNLFGTGNSLSQETSFRATTSGSGSTISGLQSRQAFVGLKKNGLGQFSVGNQYTPIHEAIGATDPGQQNNVVGSAIYPVAVNGTDLTTGAYTTRAANALVVKSDKFAGFSAKALYNLSQSNSSTNASNAVATTTGGGSVNSNGWGLAADYTWNKLLVTANYQSFQNRTTNGGFTTALNSNDNQFYGGATYDFGILKAYAGYVNRKITTTNDLTASRTAQQIGVRSFVTPTIEAWASVGQGRFSSNTAIGTVAPVASPASANFTAYQLGSNYWLSKRTNLYAIYGSSQQSSSATIASEGANQYAVGVRHTF